LKFFLGRGHSPSPDPSLNGEGNTPSPHPNPSASPSAPRSSRLRRLVPIFANPTVWFTHFFRKRSPGLGDESKFVAKSAHPTPTHPQTLRISANRDTHRDRGWVGTYPPVPPIPNRVYATVALVLPISTVVSGLEWYNGSINSTDALRRDEKNTVQATLYTNRPLPLNKCVKPLSGVGHSRPC